MDVKHKNQLIWGWRLKFHQNSAAGHFDLWEPPIHWLLFWPALHFSSFMQFFVITIFTNSWEKNIVYVGVNSSVKQYCFLISSTCPFGWMKGCVILKSGHFLLKQSYMDKTIEQIPRKVKREKLGMRCLFFS